MRQSLLLVNHDKRELARWGFLLREWGIPYHETRDGFTALQLLQLESIFGVICRADLPLISGLELSRRIKKSHDRLKVVLARGDKTPIYNRLPSGRESWDLGPVGITDKKLQEVVGLLLLTEGILLQEGTCERFLHQGQEFNEIIGRSSAINQVFSLISKVRNQEITVLIQGESGTGKELVALAIHQHSKRGDKPFISVNCAALPETLLESELFGHEKGAFTGANTRVAGRFEQADKGCLFLDEIGDMSPATQAKVLRVLEGHEFERVGGREEIKVDVRIIAATNRDLKQVVSEGKFREDLFYRIGAFPISLPPLRGRMEDLPLLVAHIIRKFNHQSLKKIKSISLPALQKLLSYNWPGNIRELENVVSRAAILAGRGVIEVQDVFSEAEKKVDFQQEKVIPPPFPGMKSLANVEEEAIREALKHTNMNVSKAALGLGISRATLYKKARQYGIAITR